jgi:hypothetical protein
LFFVCFPFTIQVVQYSGSCGFSLETRPEFLGVYFSQQLLANLKDQRQVSTSNTLYKPITEEKTVTSSVRGDIEVIMDDWVTQN